MKFRSLVAAAAALSLTTTPVLAQSASSDVGRAMAPAAQESGIEGVSSIVWIIGAIVYAATPRKAECPRDRTPA